MDLAQIPIGRNPPHDVNVIVEIPQGGAPVKYEMDKRSGAMFVDRFLHTAMFYPANYGFIPHTLSEVETRSTAWWWDRRPLYPARWCARGPSARC
jgi:inorganic pyrophosphatase